MGRIFAQWILQALALFIVSRILPRLQLEDFWTAMLAVVVISLVNALVKPILFLFTLPITILTLGLFTFILNACLFLLVARLTPGFRIDGFGTALLGSILFSIVSTILQSLVR